MKTFIAIVCLTFVAVALANKHFELSEEEKAQAKKHIDACSEELKLTAEETAKVNAKDYTNPTENIKCFPKCFFGKAGILKDGAIQDEFVLAKWGPKLGEETARATLTKCSALYTENNCESAFNLFQCFTAEKRRLADAIKA